MARVPSTYSVTSEDEPHLLTPTEKVANNIAEVDTVAQAIDDGILQTANAFEPEIRAVAVEIESVKVLALVDDAVRILAADIDGLNAIAADLGALNNVHSSLVELLLVHASLAEILNVESNLTELLNLEGNLLLVQQGVDALPKIDLVVGHLDAVDYVGSHRTELEAIYTSLGDIALVAGDMASVSSVGANIEAVKSAEQYVNTLNQQLVDIQLIESNVVSLEANASVSADIATQKATESVNARDSSEIHKLDAKAAQNASEGFRDATEIMRNQVATDTDTVSNALDSVNAQMATFEEDSSSLLSSMLQISTDLTHTQDLMVTKYPLY